LPDSYGNGGAAGWNIPIEAANARLPRFIASHLGASDPPNDEELINGQTGQSVRRQERGDRSL